MRTKIHWSHVGLVAGLLVAMGCGGGGATPSPGPAILTMYNSSIDFGDVGVGNLTTQGATFSNTGGSSLLLQQNSVSGAGFTTTGIGAGVTLNPGQYVTLAVSFDPSGAGKVSGMVSLTSSTSSAPINFPLSGNGVVAAHSVALGWSASESSVVGYNIYRNSVLDGHWIKLNSSPVTTTSYTDWDAQIGTYYLYSAKSVSPVNVESGFSTAASATIPSP